MWNFIDEKIPSRFREGILVFENYFFRLKNAFRPGY
jgi:hypothetical protein